MLAILIGKYLTPILVTVIGGFILTWIKTIQKDMRESEKRKEKQLRLIEINIEAMTYAMGKVNSGIGEIFEREFKDKKKRLIHDDNFIQQHHE